MGQHKKIKKPNHNKKVLLLLLLLSLLTFLGFLFIGVNSSNIGFYLPKRFMKVLVIILVSYCIGYSSVSFQTITNNHILTPSVMGLDSLYLFIQTIVVFFFGSKQLVAMTGINNFLLSVGIMIGVAGILFLLLFRGEGKNVYFLVLSGMVMGGLFSGLATFMQVLLDPNEFSILQGKMFASLNNINTDLANTSIIIVLIVILLTLKDLPFLDVLSLGTDQAINLGVPYKKLVRKTLMVSAVLISISAVLIGPITFLGILVVSLARRILNTYKHLELTLGTTLIACLFLGAGLFLTERVFKFATPISVIINFFGGIYFIYLMVKESKK